MISEMRKAILYLCVFLLVRIYLVKESVYQVANLTKKRKICTIEEKKRMVIFLLETFQPEQLCVPQHPLSIASKFLQMKKNTEEFKYFPKITCSVPLAP